MGSRHSYFPISEKEVLTYEAITGLNAVEIREAFRQFYNIDPLAFNESRKGWIPNTAVVERLPSLKNNPFRYRLGEVFCSSESGFMDFDDFLEMVSVLHSKAHLSVKLHWAFQVYDINNDGVICEKDLDNIIDLLTNKKLSSSEKDRLVHRILSDGDTDGDAALSFQEFERSITLGSRPEFEESFKIVL